MTVWKDHIIPYNNCVKNFELNKNHGHLHRIYFAKWENPFKIAKYFIDYEIYFYNL